MLQADQTTDKTISKMIHTAEQKIMMDKDKMKGYIEAQVYLKNKYEGDL